MTGRNRIMIYGPKEDGSYVVEFRTADGEVLLVDPQRRNRGDPALPGAHAARSVRAGRRQCDTKDARHATCYRSSKQNLKVLTKAYSTKRKIGAR
jgi:hypothetical protein